MAISNSFCLYHVLLLSCVLLAESNNPDNQSTLVILDIRRIIYPIYLDLCPEGATYENKEEYSSCRWFYN